MIVFAISGELPIAASGQIPASSDRQQASPTVILLGPRAREALPRNDRRGDHDRYVSAGRKNSILVPCRIRLCRIQSFGWLTVYSLVVARARALFGSRA